jgi:hypothetical protein
VTGPRVAYAHQLACLREERDDVVGMVPERVRRVVAPLHESTVPAAVGMDAPTDEILGVPPDDATLPQAQADPPQMLSSGTRSWPRLVWKTERAHSSGWRLASPSRPPGQAATGGMRHGRAYQVGRAAA